jgi:lycopene beta-cyclase
VIVGAGCAGLSLTVHLLEAGCADLEVLLVDRRKVHARDRTWCYWSVADHPFQSAVRHSWHRWKVITDAGEVERGSPTLAYRCIPADAFYDLALERIESAPNVRLLRGVDVTGLREAEGGVEVATGEGVLRARRVFDGRPPAPRPAPEGEIDWVQPFVGLEVETEAARFDPSVATLMDFRVMRGPEIRFMYVLPLSETTALVEDTYFGGEPLAEGEYVRSIRHYAADVLGAETWTERHRERGAIPMSTLLPPRPVSRRVTNLGTRAGLARPATGYAFMAIQRHSRRLASHVARYGPEAPIWIGRPYPRATAFLDRVFLAYLDRNPEAAPGLFLRMFGAVGPERMARFLFDGGTAADRIALMRSLPAAPLVGQAIRELGPALRDITRRP